KRCTFGRTTTSSTSAAIPSRSAVVPQEPIAGKSWVAIAAPNCREKQEPRMNSTGVNGTPRPPPEGSGPVVVGRAGAEEEVVTASTLPAPVPPGPANVSYLYREAELHDWGRAHAESAPTVPAARTAQAADDDRGRERPFDVGLGRVPAARPARAGDEGLPLRAGGPPGGAHGCGGAARPPRGGDARAAGDGGGRARPRAGRGQRAAARGVLPDADDRARPGSGQRARRALPGPPGRDGAAGGGPRVRGAAGPRLRRDPG